MKKGYKTLRWGFLRAGFWVTGKYWSFSYLEVRLIYNRTFGVTRFGIGGGSHKKRWLVELVKHPYGYP